MPTVEGNTSLVILPEPGLLHLLLQLALAVGLISFAVLVALLLVLTTMLYYGVGVVGSLIGTVLGALPVPLYVALALRIDRYEKEPLWMLYTFCRRNFSIPNLADAKVPEGA